MPELVSVLWKGHFVGVEFQHVMIPFISRNIYRNPFLVFNICIAFMPW